MSKTLKTTIKAIALGLGLGLIISTAIFGVKLNLHGKLKTGTIIANTSLEFKTPEEAVLILQEKVDQYKQAPFKFEIELEGETLSTEIYSTDVELEYMVIETVSTIGRIDLREDPLTQTIKQTQIKKSKDLLYTFNSEKLIQKLKDNFNLNETTSHNATYFFNEESRLDIKEESEGFTADFDKLINEFKTDISQLGDVEIEIDIAPSSPTITKADLEKMKDEIAEKLRHKITIKSEDDVWEFLPTHQLDGITFTETNFITLPHIGLNVELDSKYLPDTFEIFEITEKSVKILVTDDKIKKFVADHMSEDIEVQVDPVSIYKDEAGQIVINGKGKDGVVIQATALKKSLELAINSKIDAIPLHTKTIKAPITISKEVQDMGIRELLSVGHTSFYGSPSNRIHNIGVGVNKFNGTLIAPNEEFSFNKTLGRVDGTTGYLKELVITKDGTIPEYGGGLCQVSTTTYRAAIFAGLPITSRAPHSYAVSYYSQILGYGLDATIYLGGQDLRFVNDTGNYILIQSYVDGKHAYYKFYGTSDGRKVELDGPHLSNYANPPSEVLYVTSADLAPGETKQLEKKHTGFDALWYRTITRLDDTSETEEIFSRYRATQEKWQVGPQASPPAIPAAEENPN